MKTENSGTREENTDISTTEIRQARKRAAFSVFLNLMLTLGKGVAGVVGGSSALIGDAIHSATDVVGSMAAWFGLWLAGKKHPSFPYGLYKAETLATLVTSVVVMIAGYEIARQAFMGPVRIPDIALTLPVALLSLVIALGFGFYQHPYADVRTKRGLLVGKWLVGQKPDQVAVLRKSENAAMVLLEESGVEIVVLKGE